MRCSFLPLVCGLVLLCVAVLGGIWWHTYAGLAPVGLWYLVRAGRRLAIATRQS